MIVLLFLLLAVNAKQDLKTRYHSLSVEEAWKSNLLVEMTGFWYDLSVSNPWVGVHKDVLIYDYGKPKLVVFVNKAIAGTPPNAQNIKDNFIMETMHLLAEDLSDKFCFMYVVLNSEEDMIGPTYFIEWLKDEHKPAVMLI